jgi:hypothetical protein
MKLLSMINRNTISIKINIQCSGWPNCTSHVMVNMLAQLCNRHEMMMSAM